MNPQEFKAAMQKIADECAGDNERVHAEMDDLMLQLLRKLGYGDGCDIFDNTEMWCA